MGAKRVSNCRLLSSKACQRARRILSKYCSLRGICDVLLQSMDLLLCEFHASQKGLHSKRLEGVMDCPSLNHLEEDLYIRTRSKPGVCALSELARISLNILEQDYTPYIFIRHMPLSFDFIPVAGDKTDPTVHCSSADNSCK